MTAKFALADEPIDYQITVHFNNLKLYFRDQKTSQIIDEIVWLLETPDGVDEFLAMFNVNPMMFQLAHLINHYGAPTIAKYFKVFYGKTILSRTA